MSLLSSRDKVPLLTKFKKSRGLGTMMLDRLAHHAPSLSFFQQLPVTCITRFLKSFGSLTAKRDDVLCRSGDIGDSMCVVLTGTLAVFGHKPTSSGRAPRPGQPEEYITSLGVGDCIGMNCLLQSGACRTATLLAADNVCLAVLTRASYETVLDSFRMVRHKAASQMESEVLSEILSKPPGLRTHEEVTQVSRMLRATKLLQTVAMDTLGIIVDELVCQHVQPNQVNNPNSPNIHISTYIHNLPYLDIFIIIRF